MSIETKEVIVCTCAECGQSWIPKRCASCKSPLWNGAKDKRVKRAPKVQPNNDAPKVLAPIDRQSLANVKPKKKAVATGKAGLCPHKFIRLDDGSTACPQCRTGA